MNRGVLAKETYREGGPVGGGGKKRVSGDRRSTLQFQGNYPPKPQGKMIMGGWWQNIMMHRVLGVGGWCSAAQSQSCSQTSVGGQCLRRGSGIPG